MFFRFIVCLIVYFNINLCYAQYERPGWFLSDEITENVGVNKKVKNADEIYGETGKSLLNNVKNHNFKKKQPQSIEIIDRGFSLGRKELKLTSILLKNVYEDNMGKNFVFSPLSFYAVAVLLANGVVDSTLWEFSKIFSVFRLVDVNEVFKKYLYSKGESYIWSISLWGNVFSQRYRTLIGDILSAETWNLQGNTNTLNMWISEKTKGKVNKIIEERPVNDDELFVVSSLGFYQNWKYPFNKNFTRKKIFYAVDGKRTMVNMMYQSGIFEYFENDFMQVVRLFFDTGDYITFYLPHENSDFSKFVANFEDYKMEPEFQYCKVDLFIPKFQLSNNANNIREKFALLGVSEVFYSIYNFAKMINFDMQAKVSDVFLNVRVRIDEGNEQKILKDSFIKGNLENNISVIFNANRPFIFMINKGDIVGGFVKGNKLNPDELVENNDEKVGEVIIRKDETSTWYDNK